MNDPLINIATKAVRRAGEVIQQAYSRPDLIKISSKSINDLVTDVDLRAEQIIIDTVRESYPKHQFFCEESGKLDGAQDVTWIIDPIDGSNNFAHGYPHFAISVAIKQQDQITHGIIYDPLRDELFTAVKGRGAQLNQKRIRVTDKPGLQGSLLGTGFPFKNKALLPKYLKTFEPLANQSAGIRRAGSAALDLAYVAAGRLDGYWEFGLSSWDIAAGILLVQEAGGMVSDFEGGNGSLVSGNVLAANRKLFKELLQVVHNALTS